MCDRLLTCVAEVAPAALPETLSAYGPDGSCWKDAEVAQLCQSACAGTLTDYANSTGSVACTQCGTSEDCVAFDSGEYCLTGRCVVCLDDSHCPASAPHCDGDFGEPRCVADSSGSGCGPEEYRCVGTDLCLPSSWECDGDHDCPDGDDEAC